MDDNEKDLRHAAEKSLKRKRDFRNFAFIYVVVNTILIAVWALSGAGYFWPIWTIFGMGIALIFSAWDAYGGGESGPTEHQIQDEMKKLSGGN